jgi:arsenite/tail-anchored protein-transporting ATPase
MPSFNLSHIELTKYIFFTGKGGVGKTSTACATAVTLADQGHQVLLISTDPASNLQDVFEIDIHNEVTNIEQVPNLFVSNLDPIEAAAQYREKVIGPFRGKLPEAALLNMEEQLSGSCTVEIAAFNEFTAFLADATATSGYDYVIFDTAPTGHTLRLLQLPTAWDTFIEDSTHGNSCLGQLSGLEDQKDNYKTAVENLSNPKVTTMILVARPEQPTLIEAQRASKELSDIGIKNQLLIINGVLTSFDDDISTALYNKQHDAISSLPESLTQIPTYTIPLRSYNVTGVDAVRRFFYTDEIKQTQTTFNADNVPSLKEIIDYFEQTDKRIIFTMGKGGVGKSSIASAIALGLASRGINVHLASTDPAGQTTGFTDSSDYLEVSYIDEKKELKAYQDEILTKAKATMNEDQISYVEEDLRSPCTEEIAVFRAFANIVAKSNNQVVVIDTAPTGHTLLLLDSTLSYHKEIQRSQNSTPDSVNELLPKLRDPKLTEVIIVSLAQTTPVFEAQRLQVDLKRAGIAVNWWVINNSIMKTQSSNHLLKAKAMNEVEWIEKVKQHTHGKYALVEYCHETITNEKLLEWTA